MVSTISSSPFNPRPSSPSNKMSITQTYMMAHKARAKLSREAAQPDHNLRLLVGHANLLDSLMLDLAEAEREQETWFNQSVRGASAKGEDRHVQWADAIPEHTDEDWEADSSDSDSDDEDYDDEDEDIDMADVVPLRRIPSNTIVPPSPQMELMDEDDFDASEDDEEEDYDSLTLRRSPSHTASPPELDHDSDSSEDESMPPSPPFANLPTFSTKQRETTVTTAELYGDSKDDDEDEEDNKADFYSQGFYLPPRRNPARLISAISVY